MTRMRLTMSLFRSGQSAVGKISLEPNSNFLALRIAQMPLILSSQFQLIGVVFFGADPRLWHAVAAAPSTLAHFTVVVAVNY